MTFGGARPTLTDMPTSTITLFEHERVPFPWDDHDLVRLVRLNDALGYEALRLTVKGGQRVVQATQFVGVVRLGRHTIQVLPKIHAADAPKSEQVRQATDNLLHLLAEAGYVTVREHAVAPLHKRASDWFEILTHLFATHLKDEWQRGAYRAYQAVDDDLGVLKGKWRVAERARRPARDHRFDVTYDEFSADNRLNRVFRYVVERLWRLSRDVANRRLLGELRPWLDEVTLLPAMTAADAAPSLLTRLNQRYTPLLTLARLFLDDRALQLTAGDDSTFTFMFDMNALFEALVVNLIRRHRERILPVALAACDLLPQSVGYAEYLAHDADGKRHFHLRPDLAFRVGQGFPLLLDTKYKTLVLTDPRLGVSQADLYQMFAYAKVYACPRILLLYPQTAALPERLSRRLTFHGDHETVTVATLDIRRDLGKPAQRTALIDELRRILHEEPAA